MKSKDREPQQVRMEHVLERIAGLGLSANALQEGIENLVSLELVAWMPGGTVRWRGTEDERRNRSRSPTRIAAGRAMGGRERARGGPETGPTTGGTRPVVLLALFEGLGTMRLAMGTAINKAGGTAVLCASWYAEWQPSLHGAVEKYWQQRKRLTGCVPHLPTARDVWDLLRGDGRALQGVLDSAPKDASMVLAGG